MTKKQYISFLILFAAIVLLQSDVVAQCAMCRTSAESDLNAGSSIAKGLNTGILYLMAVPYLALMIGGYFFFKKPIDAKVKAFKNRHFPSKGIH